MCPLYPLHLLLTYGFLILVTWMMIAPRVVNAINTTVPMEVKLSVNGSEVEVVELVEMEDLGVEFTIQDWSPGGEVVDLQVKEESSDELDHFLASPVDYGKSEGNGEMEGSFSLTGNLRGFSKIKLVFSEGKDGEAEMMETKPVEVKVRRANRLLEKIFIYVVIILVVIAYVNMGCAIDMDVIKESLRRPIAPSIGLASQYVFMPVISYFLGYLLFRDKPALWLGLFLTGCSPGGGGSNMWTLVLGGSLDLSITMTFLSTVLAFIAMPLWIYAMGAHILADGSYGRLPYRNMIMLIIGLVVPCSCGLLMKRYTPKVAAFLRKLLRPVALLFLVFILTFGVYAHLYIFSFFTWQVVVSGLCLPLFGYIFGFGSAIAAKRPWTEVIAISIETGIQNTGLSIGVIKIALSALSPMDDLALVLPIAVATMTPLPLTIAFFVRKFVKCYKKDCSSAPTKEGIYGVNKNCKDFDVGSDQVLTISADVNDYKNVV